jgi:hypothetical protein
MAVARTRIAGSNPVFEDSELVLGLVAPVGTNFEKFQHLLDRCLRKFGYEANLVRVSDLISSFSVDPPVEPRGATAEAMRLHRMMHAGSQLRLDTGRGELLALSAASRSRRMSWPP